MKEEMNVHVFTVSEISSILKSAIEHTPLFRNITLKGEISNMSLRTNSPHLYFSLKDDDAIIRAVMFAFKQTNLHFTPKDGDEVIVKGSLSVYLKQGTYQIIVDEMEEAGRGDKLFALEELKKKLAAEGLFDENKKRPIIAYPKNIGIISAPKSAALKDLLFNINRRYPIVNIYIFPSLVQGEAAPNALMNALKLAYSFIPKLDTLIVARGGGSDEDLDAFNDENLVRTVAMSPIPIISAVGHEIDTTLVDLASDLRVSTPTAAAEKATPNKDDILLNLDSCRNTLSSYIRHYLSKLKLIVLGYETNEFFKSPSSKYHDSLLKVQTYEREMINTFKYKLKRFGDMVNNFKVRLEVSHPKQILKRGYALVSKEEKVITSVKNVRKNDRIRIQIADGRILTNVVDVEGKDL